MLKEKHESPVLEHQIPKPFNFNKVVVQVWKNRKKGGIEKGLPRGLRLRLLLTHHKNRL